MIAYLDKLREPTGLFFHAPDVKHFWGRGDGWVAVGMTEMLTEQPTQHTLREPILAAYRRMMATLLAHQADTGLWRQIIDHPENWPETSGTAMFTFAYVPGVKNGWLPGDLRPRGAEGGIALVGDAHGQAVFEVPFAHPPKRSSAAGAGAARHDPARAGRGQLFHVSQRIEVVVQVCIILRRSARRCALL